MVVTDVFQYFCADDFVELLAELLHIVEVVNLENEAIFVDANKGLFAGLATEFGATINALSALTPPTDAALPHEEWLTAARALNDVFRSTDEQLAPLTGAPEVDSVVRILPLRNLQAAYRAACQGVAALAEGDPTPVITCDPITEGA